MELVCATNISGTLADAFEAKFVYYKNIDKKRAGVRSIKSSPLILPYNISVFLSWYPILELAHSLLPSLKKMLHFLEQTIQRYVYKIQFSNCHIVPISKSHTRYNVHLRCVSCVTYYTCACSRRDAYSIRACLLAGSSRSCVCAGSLD